MGDWVYVPLGDYWLEVDTEGTAAFWVDRWRIWGWCNRLNDQNLREAADHFPPVVAAFLEQVGLLPEWPSESMWFDETPEKVYYLSLYHVRGWIIRSMADRLDLDGQAVFVAEGVTAPCPDDFPEPILEISVAGWLPWVLVVPNDAGRRM